VFNKSFQSNVLKRTDNRSKTYYGLLNIWLLVALGKGLNVHEGLRQRVLIVIDWSNAKILFKK